MKMDAVDYANDSAFRGLVSEILNMKLWSMEKFQLWLQDESKYLFQLHNFSLLECHRMWLSHLRKRNREAALSSDEKRLACLQLLQSKGLVKEAARGELNSLGEELILAAAADGWSADDINALLAAGADVATKDKDGKTCVWSAASSGNVSALKVLLGAGGDVNSCCNQKAKRNLSYNSLRQRYRTGNFNEYLEERAQLQTNGVSALYIAAWNGHVDCVEELLASKADFRTFRSPVVAAAAGGHFSCLESLIRANADVSVTNM
jgi:ankyrin repeat protein